MCCVCSSVADVRLARYIYRNPWLEPGSIDSLEPAWPLSQTRSYTVSALALRACHHRHIRPSCVNVLYGASACGLMGRGTCTKLMCAHLCIHVQQVYSVSKRSHYARTRIHTSVHRHHTHGTHDVNIDQCSSSGQSGLSSLLRSTKLKMRTTYLTEK